jgi:MFS family permease
MASMSMLNTGLTFHIFSIFRDNGLDASIAAAVFVPIAATGAIVQLGGGVLIDRIPANLLLAAALFIEVLILIMAPFLFSVPIAFGFGLMMGIASGLEMTVGRVIWAKYYGRRHLGSITGFAITIMVAASALGPMPMGIARDLLGSYEAVLIGCAILPLVLAFANLMFAKPPQRAPLVAVEPVSTT